METLTRAEFTQWLRAYHDVNPGAVFAPQSLLVDAAGRTTYERLVDAAAGAVAGIASPALLDVGCGDGILLALFGARFPHARLFGVDQSAGELEIARATLEPFGADLRRADMAARTFDAGSIDFATSHMALMLAEDPLRVLAEIGRVLKGGATLAFVVGPAGPLEGVLAHASAANGELLVNEGKTPPSLDPRFRDLDALRTLPWNDLGFTDVTVEPIPLSRKLTVEQLNDLVSEGYGAIMLSKGGREQLERTLTARAWELADANALVPTTFPTALVTARAIER